MNRLLLLAVLVIIILGGFYSFKVQQKKSSKEESPSSSQTFSKKPTIQQVLYTEKGFSPVSITIKKGEVIMWINNSKKSVTVNSNPYPVNNFFRFLNLGEFAPGSSVQAVFNNPGTYSYHNQFNPKQQGTIVVK